GADAKALRDTVDRLKDKLGSGVVVLGAVDGGKVQLVAGVTRDLTGQVKAGQLIQAVARYVEGRGGGRPDFAQAGGTRPEGLDDALACVPEEVASVSQPSESPEYQENRPKTGPNAGKWISIGSSGAISSQKRAPRTGGPARN